ncbi:hypothetical protein P170DRAFT_344579 [Aspergillus steynii IBT 23096]|uniref:ARCA-like protein n=1 Tax=Aspergillus steynii IBT 23096 TaxID=1392250 RepID=A0A2I2GMK4_9EURO|nr:uncharacterized protein P170DRAFT_344579 [Aspergillus steynii IBT 23096]PLB54079.1 hypothetical protein P170DRAFT_344579 [Aspergillus steynii IBT 23096]
MLDSASNGKPSSPQSSSSHASSPISQTKSNQPVDLPQSFWSDKEAQDACLMRYFVEELAPWFDTCDAAKNFALIAPQRAKSCPPLLYAIFSASARHLSRRQIINGNEILFAGKKLPSLGEERALEYQSLCISHLMSLSGDTTEVQDENLLAAAVILRFYEEYDAPLVGIDDETYLRGTQVFLDAQSTAAMQSGGLRRAAFWVAFRQEWHRAFIKQRGFRFNSHCCASSAYRSLEPVDDNTWTNRMVLHCTDVVDYCYGEDSSLARYDELWDYILRWQSLVPSTFNPLYSREPDPGGTEVFPEIWYLDDCIVTATQHLLLARICLVAYDPRTPRMGPGRKDAVAKGEAEIKRNLFELCGIARSNKTAPALVMACMGVTMCGDIVTSRVEQEALFDILVKLEEVHALSSSRAQMQLKEAWGWDGVMPT